MYNLFFLEPCFTSIVALHYKISDDVDPVDSEMQAKLEEMAARLENMF